MAQAEPPITPPKKPLDFFNPVVDFELRTFDDHPYRISRLLRDVEALVINFWSAECPLQQQYDAYFNGFTQSYGPKGVRFVAIDSNSYEDESAILRAIERRNIVFPILRDRGALIASYFNAETTPHIFVFDRGGSLRYRGAVDDRTTESKSMTMNYLENAVESLLLGREEVNPRETTSFGCPIVREWGME